MSDDLDLLLADLSAAAGAAAEHGPLGAGTSTVARIARRVHHRRAARRAGAGAVVVCAAGAVTFGASQWHRDTVGPIASDLPTGTPPASSSIADWPAQFDRCGKPVDDVLDSAGDVTLEATTSPGTGNQLDVHTVMSGPADALEGWIYGTELTVTDETGTVVGVQEGRAVPPLDQLDEAYANVDFAGMAFPLESRGNMPVVSCAQYPTGFAGPNLAPGEYHLWVTQTVGYVGGGREIHARTSTEVPLVVGPDGTPSSNATQQLSPTAGTPAEQYFACGQPVDLTIHTLPAAGGLTLAADLPAGGWGAAAPSWSATVGAAGGQVVTAYGAAAGNLALVGDDGTVAGFVAAGRGPLRTVQVGPDSTDVLDGPTLVVPCSDQPLHGTYTAWPFVVEKLVEDVSDPSGPGAHVVVVANPRQVTFGS